MLSGVQDGKKDPCPLGHFFIAINIPHFIDVASFSKTAGDILRELRASRKMPGQPRIYTAGEKEYLAWVERKDKGVPINRNLQREILQMQHDLGLTGYHFPFQ